MEEVINNQNVNNEPKGFIADFLEKLNSLNSINDKIIFTENQKVEFKNKFINSDNTLRDLEFILCELKGKPYSITDNEEMQIYYENLRKRIKKFGNNDEYLPF